MVSLLFNASKNQVKMLYLTAVLFIWWRTSPQRVDMQLYPTIYTSLHNLDQQHH